MNEVVLLVILVVAASVLSISVEWHVSVTCLWVVYAVTALWLVAVATPELAVAKVATGTTVCTLLAPGLRSVSSARSRGSGTGVRALLAVAGSASADEPFMLVGALLAASAASALSFSLPLIEGANNFAWYWLALLGLLLIMLSRDLVRIGIGLLLLLNAVDLLDTMVARNQGVAAIGARSVVTIVLGFAMSVIWNALQKRTSVEVVLARGAEYASDPPDQPLHETQIRVRRPRHVGTSSDRA